jgi:hypothetical protein
MKIAIHIPGMLRDGDVHFRFGHIAPVPFLAHTDP